ncbi:MAG: hypothetical protein U5K27_16390 [Desulfotignum sp.]|nr:hypothetical protein [Desulfotignum sp.]
MCRSSGCSRGLADAESFLCLLAEPHVVQFQWPGAKRVLKFQENQVLNLLTQFNDQHLEEMCRHLDIDLPPLSPADFLRFAFPGQPSVPLLAEFIHARALTAMKKRVDELHEIFHQADDTKQAQIRSRIEQMDRFSVKQILDTWLNPQAHPDIFQSRATTEEPGYTGPVETDPYPVS